MFNNEARVDFWYFCNERYKIYLNKESGAAWPWTEDKILQEWKFCNVFRNLDATTVWLIDNVIKPHWAESPGLMLFNLFAFRAFNSPETFDWITAGEDWLSNFYFEKLETLLNMRAQTHHLTSGAYMLRGREGMPKQHSILLTLQEIWQFKNYHVSHFKDWMEPAYLELLSSDYWGWGPFTLYQVILDLTYSPILFAPGDIDTWCVFGPGAKRGLREIWPDLETKHELEAAKTLLVDQEKYLEDYMPIMTLQDIEFSLCEMYKYRRIKAGGKGKSRYARFEQLRAANGSGSNQEGK